MKLTDGEKLIVVMLADIHRALEIKDGVDSDLVLDAIGNGHLWSLEWDMPGVFQSEEVSETIVTQTCDVLDMWGMIELSFAELPEDEKIEVRNEFHGHDPKFYGFDGNNERHFGVSIHLIRRMGRFESFKDRELNAHMPTIDGYMRMYEVFRPLRSELGTRRMPRLTAAEIKSILAARYRDRS